MGDIEADVPPEANVAANIPPEANEVSDISPEANVVADTPTVEEIVPPEAKERIIFYSLHKRCLQILIISF